MTEFNDQMVFGYLQRINYAYHLSHDSLDFNSIYAIINNGLNKDVPLHDVTMELLEYLSPGLHHYVKCAGITYPYDLDLEVEDVLVKAGYPNEEEEELVDKQ